MPEVFLNGFAEPLIGKGAVLLDGASVKHQELACLCQALNLVEQAGLARAGIASHDDELAFAADGCIEPLLQLGQLLFSPDEWRKRLARQHQRAG